MVKWQQNRVGNGNAGLVARYGMGLSWSMTNKGSARSGRVLTYFAGRIATDCQTPHQNNQSHKRKDDMGMGTFVIGVRLPDERWQEMKRVWDACVAAGVPVPDAVAAFFAYEEPDPAGVMVELPPNAVREWEGKEAEGIEVILAGVPSDVTVIRFYNSW